MRVLISSCTYHPALNGQSIFVVNLAEGLAAAGHEVCVLYPEPKPSRGTRNGVRLEVAGSYSLGWFHEQAYLSLRFGKVRPVFDDFKPDVVHIHDHYPLEWAAVREARRRHIPVMGTNHYSPASLKPYLPLAGTLRPAWDWILWNWMLWLYDHLDMVTAPSKAAVDLLVRVGLHVPSRPITCGVNMHRFRPDPSVDRSAVRAQYGLDPKRVLVVYVGRVDQEKRIDVLIRAMSHLAREDVQLAVAGAGSDLPRLSALAKSLNLEDRVRFLGPVPNDQLNPLLNAADIFAMAGDSESLSIASLEAMAAGKPVLLANAFALPQLVQEGGNGYLFRRGDAEDCARCISRLVHERDRWPEMGRLGMQKAATHSLDGTIQRYAALYEELIARKASQ